jgi:magnesium-protoporphyrin IX monomethyl ester (oxidative) cyclase
MAISTTQQSVARRFSSTGVVLIQPGWIVRGDDIQSMFARCGVPQPIGLAYIASYLEQRGVNNVHILDALALGWHVHTPIDANRVYIGLREADVCEYLWKTRPRLVGITTMYSAQSESMHIMAGWVKMALPDVRVVVGGGHPSCCPGDCLENPHIDAVVPGEGEEVAIALVDAIDAGLPLEKVPGLLLRDKNGKPVLSSPMPLIKTLDTIPMPAYEKLPMQAYFDAAASGLTPRGVPARSASLFTSRGCPYTCIFCSIYNIYGFRWRSFPPSHVVDEIEHLVTRYRVQHINFEDDNLTLHEKRAEEICDEIIRRKLSITWSAPNGVRVDHLNPSLLRKMKQSGCISLSLGIESGSQEFLDKVIRKELDLSIVGGVVREIRRAGITAIGFFVIGIPGENEATARQTIEFARKLGKQGLIAHFFLAVPLPGTDLYREAKEKGYLLKEHPTAEDYFLAPYQKPLLRTPDYDDETLFRWRRRAIFANLFAVATHRPWVLLKYFSGTGTLGLTAVVRGFLRKLHLLVRFVVFSRAQC